MFLYNNWYVAAFSGDVEANPVGRLVCGLPIVFYRDSQNRIVALEDRCIHRGMPFSKGGKCIGDRIQCPYHAMEFDSSGQCVEVPGQNRIPENARILRYEVVEREGLIWVWPGDAALADPSLIAAPEYHSKPGWTVQNIFLDIAADWQLLQDNLLDLTHLGVVHARTIGGNPDQHGAAHMKVEKRGSRGLAVIRRLPASDPPPHYETVMNFKGKIDRWTDIEFTPGVITIWSGGTDAGTGAYDGVREGGVQFRGFHAITPQADGRLYYHFTQSFNFEADDALAKKLHENARLTLLEDLEVLEAQQERRQGTPDRPVVDFASDAGGIQARRIVSRLIDQERQQMAAE